MDENSGNPEVRLQTYTQTITPPSAKKTGIPPIGVFHRPKEKPGLKCSIDKLQRQESYQSGNWFLQYTSLPVPR